MSDISQPTDFSDLYTELMNRVHAETSKATTIVIAKRSINKALYDMHVGFTEKFPWAERQAILVTKPKYTTGTVTVESDRTALTGVSTLWDTAGDYGSKNAIVGGKVVIAGSVETYELTTVTDNTNAILGSLYIPATLASGAEYTYFEDDYALASDFLRPIDQRRFSQGATAIELISRSEFRKRYPSNRFSGTPKVATLFDIGFVGSATRQRRLRLHPWSATAMAMPYSYITSNLAVSSAGAAQADMVLDADQPIVPLIYRNAIVLHALYNQWIDKDDSRSQEVKAEYTDLVSRVVSDNEIGDNHARIVPRTGMYKSRARTPWRGGGGRNYDLNNRFDNPDWG